MALATKVGNYAGGQEAIGADVEATLDSIIERVNSITNEQLADSSVSTTKIVDLAITLAKMADSMFTADTAGRGKFASNFVTRDLQSSLAKGAGAYVQYTEQYASGSNPSPSTSTGGTWNTRGVNTLVTDVETVGAGAPSGSQFSLPSGTYICLSTFSSHLNAGNAKLRLRNITGSVTSLVGLSMNSGASKFIHMSGRFTLSSTSTMQIQHYTQNAGNPAYGLPVSSGENEIYGVADLWKVG